MPSLHKDRCFLTRRKQVSGANGDAREFSALSSLSGGCYLEGLNLVAWCVTVAQASATVERFVARGQSQGTWWGWGG